MGLRKEAHKDLLKRRISAMVFISVCLLKTSMVVSDPISPPAEIGDIAYQTHNGTWTIYTGIGEGIQGHAMVYIGHYENYSTKRFVHIVPNQYVSFYTVQVHDISATWVDSTLNEAKRRQICDFVMGKIGIWYYSSIWDMRLGRWKGQDNRAVCHGLAEAAYESVQLNPMPDGSEWPTYPRNQYESANIRDAVVVLPNGGINSPEDGDIVRSKISIITNSVSDTAYGSGIYKVEFFYDDNNLIGTDQHICNISDTYRFDNWDTKNILDGEHDLYLKVHDRGGNIKQTGPITIYIDNTRPTVTNKKP